MKPKVVVILGPTASGKSALALSLAKKFKGEIISADSRQLYRGLTIGTSKPTKVEQKKIPHHLIDVADINRSWSLADYQKQARIALSDCWQKNHLPILVGGTGLYLSAIIENFDLPSAPPNKSLRNRWQKLSTKQLASLLKKKSPSLAKNIDVQNRRRLVRALEMAMAKTTTKKSKMHSFDIYILGLNPDRDELYRKINRRVDQMVQRGLEAEAKKLFKKYRQRSAGYKLLLATIGYQEWPPYWQEKMKRSEAVEKIKQNTRNYAKRQMTWFRGMEKKHHIHWVKNKATTVANVSQFIKDVS